MFARIVVSLDAVTLPGADLVPATVITGVINKKETRRA